MLGHRHLFPGIFADKRLIGPVKAVLLQELPDEEARIVLRLEVLGVMLDFGWLSADLEVGVDHADRL